MRHLSLSHGPADSWQRTRFPVPDTSSSLRLLRDPVQGRGSASRSEPSPLTPLLNAAAGIPRFRCKQKLCALLLCNPPKGSSPFTICTAQVWVPVQTPRTTWQSSHTASIVLPGCPGPAHSCGEMAICTSRAAAAGYGQTFGLSSSHSRADVN